MRFLAAVLCLCTCLSLTGCSKMPVPDQFTEIDEALRQQGVTPTITSDSWQVRLPPEVIGTELNHWFIELYAQDHNRGEYLWFVTLTVHRDGMVTMQTTYRSDKDGTNYRTPWPVAKLKECRKLNAAEKHYRVKPMDEEMSQRWLQDVLLKNVRDPKFAQWLAEIQ
jgi:hypothetical protein